MRPPSPQSGLRLDGLNKQDLVQKKLCASIGDIRGRAKTMIWRNWETINLQCGKFKPQDTFDILFEKNTAKTKNFSVFKSPQFSRIATLVDFS